MSTTGPTVAMTTQEVVIQDKTNRLPTHQKRLTTRQHRRHRRRRHQFRP